MELAQLRCRARANHGEIALSSKVFCGSCLTPPAGRSRVERRGGGLECSPVLAKTAYSWRLVTAAPPREVFATMEQLIGTRPYRFEVTGEAEARIVEHRRRGLFGQWSRPRVRVRWVSCRAEPDPEGTRMEVVASSGGGLIAKAMGRADRGPTARAIQLVTLFAAGPRDPRTIYRDRRIPPGPVTLVASWAGTPYRLFLEPRFDAPRGEPVLTASRLTAIPGGTGPFVHVRAGDGVEGFVERDQVVAAPDIATREAQEDAARFV